MARKVMNGLDLGNQRIINLGDGTTNTDAITKQQLDAAIRGLDWKPEVVAASVGNITLTAPGTALDGVTLAANDRILLKDQTAPAENGIYVWTASGATLTRALDANTGVGLSGSTTTVQRGTVNADRVYRVTADDPITLGTTAITWVQVGAGSTSYTAGNGLTLTGSTFAVGAGTGIAVSTGSTAIDTAVVVRKFAANVGNGALTAIVLNHALGTRDVTVSVYDTTTWEEVFPDIVHTDTANVTLNFATAPASNAYRAVIHG